MASLREDLRIDAHELANVRSYELGDIDGVELTFSDATPIAEQLLVFTASAEAEDGRICGSVVGTLEPDGTVERLRTIDRKWKVEGVHAAIDTGVSTSPSSAIRTTPTRRRRCCRPRCRSTSAARPRLVRPRPEKKRRPKGGRTARGGGSLPLRRCKLLPSVVGAPPRPGGNQNKRKIGRWTIQKEEANIHADMQHAIDAIAEPRRREILRLVRDAELPAGAIAAHFADVTRPAVSQHLRTLREAGLVAERREGTRRLTGRVPRGSPACASSSISSGTSASTCCAKRPNEKRGEGQVTVATGTEPIVKEVQIDAKPETVFGFFTEPDKLTRWLCEQATTDPRPGGVCLQTHRGGESRGGPALPHARRVRGGGAAVAPGLHLGLRRAVRGRRAGIEHDRGHAEPEGEGTRLTLVHRDLPEAELASHDEGWDYQLARLAIAAAGGDPG